MNESKGQDEISPITIRRQTETSPLKRNETKRSWLLRFFWGSENDNEQGSLKIIVIIFFVLTLVCTIALMFQIYYGKFEIKPQGSIVTDNVECSEIGLNILKEGGNAVDAAIAATMCLGVVNFHITGLGGGGIMLIYNHRKHKVLDILDFQATIPKSYGDGPLDTAVEGLTVGVPGFLMGMWEAHANFGKLPWHDLIMPASNLAKKGFKVTKEVISSRSHLNLQSSNNLNLAKFLNLLVEDKPVLFPELAATLELIALRGATALYNGSLAMDIVYSVKEANGSMTLDDISQYSITRSELLHSKFENYEILAPGFSTGGAYLLNALDKIQFLDLNSEDESSSIIINMSDILHDTYISFLEKHNANPSEVEPAASVVSTTDNQDIYVSVVTGLNTWLGSQLLTGAGFILNNAIVNGGIDKERRPVSFATPVIALESGEICGKRFISGSGDASILAQVLTNTLMLKNNISESVEVPRFFIDNIPRHIRVEDKHFRFYDPAVLNKLKPLLKIEKMSPPYKSINIIEKLGDFETSYSDSRGGGKALKLK